MKNKLQALKRLRDSPLRYKFALLVSSVVLMMGLLSIFLVESRVANALHAEHRERSLTIARSIEAYSIDLIFTDNRIKLQHLLSKIKNTETDVEYIFVLDTKKNIFAHTFGEKGFPEVLLAANPLTSGDSTSFRHLQFDNLNNTIDDLAILLMEGDAGEIHIGLSEAHILKKIATIRQELIIIIILVCLVGLCATFFFSRIINNPLQSLAIASDKFGQGEHIHDLPITAHDEIGRLTATFNQMMNKIKRSHLKQKKVEKALRLEKDNWERTFNAISDIVTLQTPDMCIVKTNASGCKALGISYGEIIGQHCHKLFHDSSQPCHECPLLKTRKTFAPYTKEMHHEKLGKTFLVSASPVLSDTGDLTHLVHVATDITAIKESEKDRIRLAAAINHTSETIVITDLEGRIQYVNPAFEKLTGYSRQEAIDQTPSILRSGKHDQAFYDNMWATILRGEIWHGHLTNKRKDGTLFEEEATISPVKNDQGQITNFIAVKRDVSREVSLELQLRQAMKMEAMGTLAGGIAHDFNNILTAMLGYSEMASDQLASDDPIKADLEQVITAGNRATALVKQILTFSRQGEEELRPVKVQNIIHEVLKLLRSSLPTTISLEESIEPNCEPILADPTQIHQVLMNLCTNAKHAIGESIGTLSIALTKQQVREKMPRADCPQLPAGTYLDLEISDTGCGMDIITCASIFDPFFTTKEKGTGTGLGLAVVHGIIKQHQGEIAVTSKQGQGTTFHIYFPLMNKEMPSKDKEPSRDRLQGNGERILIVDDEEVVTNLMQRVVERMGYTTTIFTSSIEALAAYKQHPENIDLVITDMTMPEMTGLDLSKELLALQPDLPIILCTGFSEVTNEAHAKSFGIRTFIRKPIASATLGEAIQEAIKPLQT